MAISFFWGEAGIFKIIHTTKQEISLLTRLGTTKVSMGCVRKVGGNGKLRRKMVEVSWCRRKGTRVKDLFFIVNWWDDGSPVSCDDQMRTSLNTLWNV